MGTSHRHGRRRPALYAFAETSIAGVDDGPSATMAIDRMVRAGRKGEIIAPQTLSRARRLAWPPRPAWVALEQYHPDWNREANQDDEIAREPTAGAFPLRVEML
jgi:hypothetical protein